MKRQFVIELDEQQTAALFQLAGYRGEDPEDTLRAVALAGLDLALQSKAQEEREAAGLHRPRDPEDTPF